MHIFFRFHFMYEISVFLECKYTEEIGKIFDLIFSPFSLSLTLCESTYFSDSFDAQNALKIHSKESSPNLLQQCNDRKIPLTVHAGEFPVIPETNENIKIALKYNVIRRIGHGLTLQFDEDLARNLQRAGVGVECCLTSNVGGSKKCAHYGVHPIAMMRRLGIKCTLNSDNILLSGDDVLRPCPSNEIEKYVTEIGADWNEIKAVLMNAATMSYDKTIDEKWIGRFESAIDAALSEDVDNSKTRKTTVSDHWTFVFMILILAVVFMQISWNR